MLMSPAKIRAEIARCLSLIQDERFLKVVHSMLNTYIEEQETDPIIGYEAEGTGVTASTFVEQADAAIAAAKAGSGISAEELDKQSEQWLARTR